MSLLLFLFLIIFETFECLEIGTKIVNRRPKLCTTKQGDACVFPFTYRGVRYEKCTYARSSTPWCATLTNSQGEVITNKWGDCHLDGDTSCEVESRSDPQDTAQCVTQGGPSSNRQCVFPFTHDGVVYNECTTAGLGQAWCSVSTWPNGTHKAGQGLYGLCPATCPGAGGTCRPGSTWQVECNTCTCSLLSTPVCTLEDCSAKPTCIPGDICLGCYKSTPQCFRPDGLNACGYDRCMVTEGPARGQDCVFPFRWGGETHYTCATWTFGGVNQGKRWCSTKTDYQDNHVNGQGNIGFCCSDCEILNGTLTKGGTAQRSKFVQKQDDRVKLPDSSAVLFGDSENFEERKLPPS